ncbi:MAG: hypothetical protein ACPGUE_01535 [Marinomonas sp.]
MNKLSLCAASICIGLMALPVFADELDETSQDESSTEVSHGFFISPGFVYSNIDIANNFANENVGTDAFGLDVSFGYEFKSHFILQLDALFAENFSLGGASDRYSLSHQAILIGYRFAWESVSLIPFYGKAYWDLTSKEGQLFNPGAEAVEELDGSNRVFGLGLLGHIGDTSDLQISYKDIDADFGGYSVLSMGVRFKF